MENRKKSFPPGARQMPLPVRLSYLAILCEDLVQRRCFRLGEGQASAILPVVPCSAGGVVGKGLAISHCDSRSHLRILSHPPPSAPPSIVRKLPIHPLWTVFSRLLAAPQDGPSMSSPSPPSILSWRERLAAAEALVPRHFPRPPFLPLRPLHSPPGA